MKRCTNNIDSENRSLQYIFFVHSGYVLGLYVDTYYVHGFLPRSPVLGGLKNNIF